MSWHTSFGQAQPIVGQITITAPLPALASPVSADESSPSTLILVGVFLLAGLAGLAIAPVIIRAAARMI